MFNVHQLMPNTHGVRSRGYEREDLEKSMITAGSMCTQLTRMGLPDMIVVIREDGKRIGEMLASEGILRSSI